MRALIVCLALILAACGGGSSGDAGIVTPPPTQPKPDPYLTIRVRDLMDTTTASGRAHWHVYALLTGPYTAQNGIANQGAIGLNDIRAGHNVLCSSISADSVGQRLVVIIAIADTTTSNLTPDATAQSIVTAWYGGNHVLPSGYAALTFPPIDAWLSAQYLAGHGLTRADPIKWGFDWTASGSVSFFERTDADPTCSTF